MGMGLILRFTRGMCRNEKLQLYLLRRHPGHGSCTWPGYKVDEDGIVCHKFSLEVAAHLMLT